MLSNMMNNIQNKKLKIHIQALGKKRGEKKERKKKPTLKSNFSKLFNSRTNNG